MLCFIEYGCAYVVRKGIFKCKLPQEKQRWLIRATLVRIMRPQGGWKDVRLSSIPNGFFRVLKCLLQLNLEKKKGIGAEKKDYVCMQNDSAPRLPGPSLFPVLVGPNRA